MKTTTSNQTYFRPDHFKHACYAFEIADRCESMVEKVENDD